MRADDRPGMLPVLTDLGLHGAVVTLLLSPLASFMTGAVIPLDGGQVIDRE